MRQPKVGVEERFNRFEDYTAIQGEAPTVVAKPWRNELTMVVRAFHKGQDRKPAEHASFTLRSWNKSGWLYLDLHAVTLLIDGERFQPEEVKHDGSVGSGGSVSEIVRFQLDEATAKKLAQAFKVEGKVGPTEFELPPEALGVIKDWYAVAYELKKIEPKQQAPAPKKGLSR